MRPLVWAPLLLVGCSLAAAGDEAAPASVFTLSEVRPGQRGSVRTVLSHSRIEEIPLEILGVAPGFAGPGRDVILARLEGPRAEWIGVAAGMSGSPVTVDGRLLGALAYRIGSFTRDAIAGITPIEQMLRIPREAGTLGSDRPAPVGPRALLEVIAGAPGAGGKMPARGRALFATPLAISGLHPLVEEHLLPELVGIGLGPVMVAGEGRTGGEEERALAGGDPIAVVLVRGDMTVAGTGTVTLVEGDDILAMGHPLVRAGEVEFPMARASILVTVPSEASSFKMARIGETIGVFHQDRPQGLAGRIGDRARLTPVTLELDTPDGAGRVVHHFEIVRTPALIGSLVQLVVANTLLTADAAAVTGTIRISGRVRIEGREPIGFQAGFPGGVNGQPVAMPAARYVSALVTLMQQAALREEAVLAVELSCVLDPRIRLLRVEQVLLDGGAVVSGGTIRATAILRDEETGRRHRQEMEVPLPDLAPGTRLELLIGDAAALARADGVLPPAAGAASDLDSLARFLSRLRPPDRLYARISRPAPGLMLNSEPLPDLPPSVAAVLGTDGSGGGHRPLGLTEVRTRDWSQDAIVRGAIRLMMTVE